MRLLAGIFLREARLAWAGGGGAAGPTAFFLACITLGPLAIGPADETLRVIGPGLMAIAALLSVLQAAERLFTEDVSDGTLELYVLTPVSLPLLALAKVLGQAAATLWALPLIAIVGAMMYGLELGTALLVGAALLAAIPALALLAGFAGALSAGVKRGGLLISLIAMPLMVPVLVFAAGTGRAALDGEMDRAFATLLLTCAVSLGTIAVAPFGIAAAMRARLG
ncbi:MAG: cytochrome C biogenesis protein [Alphaproteobacteria bacterium]|nr:cytochrome C biogenesis protein [Alphaproteobacteria bacterium]